jgi:hypothetical protein
MSWKFYSGEYSVYDINRSEYYFRYMYFERRIIYYIKYLKIQVSFFQPRASVLSGLKYRTKQDFLK